MIAFAENHVSKMARILEQQDPMVYSCIVNLKSHLQPSKPISVQSMLTIGQEAGFDYMVIGEAILCLIKMNVLELQEKQDG